MQRSGSRFLSGQSAARTIIGVSTSYERLANRLGHALNVPIVPALSESFSWRYCLLNVAPAIADRPMHRLQLLFVGMPTF